MKVRFYCDSGANIHSCRDEIVDLNSWNISDEEWKNMSDDEKEQLAVDWANESLEIGYQEL
jgi:hypothetical protein